METHPYYNLESVVEPKKFVEKDVTKLSQDELSKYHTIVF